MRRLPRSKWFWVAVCVGGGAVAVTIADWLVLRQGLQLADALAKPGTTRTYSISSLNGLISVQDTKHPYLWFAVGSTVIGSGLGLVVWLFGAAGLWVWRRWTARRGSRVDDRAARADN